MIIKKCEFRFTGFSFKYLDNTIILFTHRLNQISYYRLWKNVGQGIKIGRGGATRGEFKSLCTVSVASLNYCTKVWELEKYTNLTFGHFTTIFGHFFATYIFIFHKT